MADRYYLDTCVWRDYFEGRSDRFRPLGEWAFSPIRQAIQKSDLLLVSDLVEEELLSAFDQKDVDRIFSILPQGMMVRIETADVQLKEAIMIGKKFGVPVNDALHAVIARDEGAILVTRDKHFMGICEGLVVRKPEELI